jgi:GxxExxY protein
MLRVVSPLSDREEQVFSRAMDCAFAVHRELGPGYREKIYSAAYCLELDLMGIKFERERRSMFDTSSGSFPASASTWF